MTSHRSSRSSMFPPILHPSGRYSQTIRLPIGQRVSRNKIIMIESLAKLHIQSFAVAPPDGIGTSRLTSKNGCRCLSKRAIRVVWPTFARRQSLVTLRPLVNDIVNSCPTRDTAAMLRALRALGTLHEVVRQLFAARRHPEASNRCMQTAASAADNDRKDAFWNVGTGIPLQHGPSLRLAALRSTLKCSD